MEKSVKKNNYFKYLISIYFNEMKNENFKGVRDLSKREIRFINRTLEDFFTNIRNYATLDVLLEQLLNLVGRLWLIQPFVDGNTRTLNRFVDTILASLEYHINIDENVIPLFYDLSDTCTKNHVNKIKSKIHTYKK